MRCRNCGGEMAVLWEAVDENRKIAGRFAYVRCTACGVIALGSPPADLGRYYAGDYFTMPSPARLNQLAAREDCKMAAVMRFVSSGRLLEVGPATGAFATRAMAEGFDVTVIEQDARCCAFLRAQPGLDVIEADDPHAVIPSLPAFDAIVLWHVIEHLREPFKFLDTAAKSLAPGGLLVLATPNPDAFQFRWMGRRWPHVDAPRHLFLLPAKALIERARGCGLTVCLLDSDDADARSWNRFGWQRLVMNRLPTRAGDAAGLAAGAVLSMLAAPFDRAPMSGCAYTLALRKDPA